MRYLGGADVLPSGESAAARPVVRAHMELVVSPGPPGPRPIVL